MKGASDVQTFLNAIPYSQAKQSIHTSGRSTSAVVAAVAVAVAVAVSVAVAAAVAVVVVVGVGVGVSLLPGTSWGPDFHPAS